MMFFKNGVCQGVAFEDILDGCYYPALSLYKSIELQVHFGPRILYPPEPVSASTVRASSSAPSTPASSSSASASTGSCKKEAPATAMATTPVAVAAAAGVSAAIGQMRQLCAAVQQTEVEQTMADLLYLVELQAPDSPHLGLITG